MLALLCSAVMRRSAIPLLNASMSACAEPIAPLLKYITATVGRLSAPASCAVARSAPPSRALPASVSAAMTVVRLMVPPMVVVAPRAPSDGQRQSFRSRQHFETAAQSLHQLLARGDAPVHFVVRSLRLVV